MSLFGRDRLGDAVAAALRVPADGIMVIVSHDTQGLTRFANSQIHQNVWSENVEVRVVAVLDGTRVGVATGPSLAPDAVARVARDAVALARVTPPNPEFPGLAPPAAYDDAGLYDEETANASPAARAELVARAVRDFPDGVDAAGYLDTATREVFIASTTGLRAYANATRAGFTCMAIAPDSTGFAESQERRLGDIDTGALAARSLRTALAGRNPAPIEPGTYPVILEPAATSTLLEYLAYAGFGAKAFLEGRSFLSGRLGEHVMSDQVTIVDDPAARDSLGLPFDAEGTPCGPVTLIEAGIARDVVWDRATASKAGRASSGHGTKPPNPDGPFPISLTMKPGTRTLDQMIASTERGLLVSRFHYTNIVNEKETVLTGMTRHGTFLIENGAIARPVTNLRFTQNAAEALAGVEAVGDTTERAADLFEAGARAPAVKIQSFRFSSTTS